MTLLSIDCGCGATVSLDDAKGIARIEATALIEAFFEHHKPCTQRAATTTDTP